MKVRCPALLAVLLPVAACATAPAPQRGPASTELEAIFSADQADRQVDDIRAIDWDAISTRDREREARVKELYRQGAFESAADWYHAAMVLQHASEPADYLLAHDWCVAAIALGSEPARWLAAATLDRYLDHQGKPQQFGTQYRSDSPGAPWKLSPVDGAITDQLRTIMHVPTLAEAERREAEMNRKP